MYPCIFEEPTEVRRKDASVRMDCSMFCAYASKIDLDIIAWMVSWDLIGVCIEWVLEAFQEEESAWLWELGMPGGEASDDKKVSTGYGEAKKKAEERSDMHKVLYVSYLEAGGGGCQGRGRNSPGGGAKGVKMYSFLF